MSEVLIIGGGIAGIQAALDLKELTMIIASRVRPAPYCPDKEPPLHAC